MKIGTTGIVINESGQVLLIQRDDTRTFAPPGGGLEAGELPTENAVREVREETGLIVLPVRLVGLYFWPMKPEGMLNFVFRCIQRGGELTPSPESPQVDFFWPRALPKSMLAMHRERVSRAVSHQGGPIDWETEGEPLSMRLGWLWLKFVVYPLMKRRRRQNGEPPYVPSPQWQVTAFAIIRNEEGRVLWLQDGDAWRLPGGANGQLEAPWETAVRHTRQQTSQPAQLTNLTGVYIHKTQPRMTMVFTGTIREYEVDELSFFNPGQEPANCSPLHASFIADTLNPEHEVVFRFQANGD